MTDHQWDGMLKMVLKIMKHCDTKEDAMEEIADLLRDAGDKNQREIRNKT